MRVDLAELRRLHEAAVEWAGTQTALREREEARAEVIRSLPSLLDRLEAAEAEVARLQRVEEILRGNMDSCELRHAEQEIRALDSCVGRKGSEIIGFGTTPREAIDDARGEEKL